MKHFLSCCTFVMVLLSVYALCSGSNLPQANKKVGSPNEQNNLVGANVGRQYTPQKQALDVGAGAATAKDEARQKRSQRDFSSSEFRDFNEIIDDLEDNTIASAVQPQELDLENMPPLTYYLLLQKLKQLQSNEPTYRVRTPRLGRSIDLRHLDTNFGRGIDLGSENEGNGYSNGNPNGNGIGIGIGGVDGVRQQQKLFVSRLSKKSVPFKPRLGKRTQQAMLCD